MSSPIFFYFLASLLVIWLMSFTAYIIKKKRQKKTLIQLQANWGKPNTNERNFDLIENFSLLTTSTSFHLLSKQTIVDIDLHDLFTFIDRTNSKPGQQYLFNKLVKPTNDIPALENFNQQVNFFAENKAAREETQLLLSPLNHHDAYYIANLLKDKLLDKPGWAWLFAVDSIVVIVMLICSFKFPVLFIWLMIPLALNIFFHYWNKKNTEKFIRSFPQLDSLINISKLLLKKELPFEKKNVQQSISRLKGFQKKFRLLNFGQAGDNDIAQMMLLLVELVKAFFLIEIHSFFSSLKELRNKRDDVNNLINYIGSIDAALSTAALRAGNPLYTTPVFTEQKRITGKKPVSSAY